MKKLYVSEVVGEGWYLSFGGPEFQASEAIKIDEETAKEILVIQATLTPQGDNPKEK